MINKIAYNVADILSNNGVIKEHDKDKCRYGIELMILSVSEFLAVMLLSLFVGNFIETLLFFAVMIPLRIYAGGYHAGSRVRCFMVMIAVYIMFSLFLKNDNAKICTAVIWIGSAFSIAVTIIFAPVLHSNKHLTKKEIRTFRKFAIIICCVETVLILLALVIFGYNVYILSCEGGQLAVTVSIISAKIKKYGVHA